MHSGSFYRSISLPAHVQGDKATADFEDGVLKVTIPKEKAKAVKKVKITMKKKISKK